MARADTENEPPLPERSSPPSPRVIETRTAKLWLGDDGILRAVFPPNIKGTLEDAKQLMAALAELVGDRRRPLLVWMDLTSGGPREARAFGVREGTRYVSASAMVVRSQTARVIASFFLGMNKPSIPAGLFGSEPEALAWLKRYV